MTKTAKIPLEELQEAFKSDICNHSYYDAIFCVVCFKLAKGICPVCLFYNCKKSHEMV